MPEVDYDALAEKARGASIDYEALAAKARGEVVLSAQEPSRALYGGPGATIGPGTEESFVSAALRRLRGAVAGPPERADARAAGIGLNPTAADLGKTALAGAGAMTAAYPIGALATAPGAAAIGLGGAYLGGQAGEYVGGKLDRAPLIGRLTGGYAAPVLGTAGMVLGGGYAAKGGMGAIRDLLAKAPHGSPMVRSILERLGTAGGAAEAEAPAVAAKVAQAEAVPAAAKVVQIRPAAVPVTPEAVQAAQADLEKRVLTMRDLGIAPKDIAASLQKAYKLEGRGEGLTVPNVRELVNGVLKANAPNIRTIAKKAVGAAPKALEEQLQDKVMGWAQGSGLSRAQMATSLRELYPGDLTPASAREAVDTILDAMKVARK